MEMVLLHQPARGRAIRFLHRLLLPKPSCLENENKYNTAVKIESDGPRRNHFGSGLRHLLYSRDAVWGCEPSLE